MCWKQMLPGTVFVLLVLAVSMEVTSANSPPSIRREQVEVRQILRAGRNVRLTCPVESSPELYVDWDKDGERITFGWGRFRISGNDLRIKDLLQEDTGRYTCTATNGFGSDSLQYLLYVHEDTNDTVSLPFDPEGPFFPEIDGRGEPPQFTNPEQMQERNQLKPVGSTVRLRCKASGRPKPQIAWYHDNRIIPAETIVSDEVEGIYSDKWTLKLSEVTMVDSGRYMCRVINRAGAINHTYNLEVVEKLKEHPLLIAPHPENRTVRYGEMASFLCRVRSDSPTTITWLKRVDDAAQLGHRNDTFNLEDEEFLVLETGHDQHREDGSYLNKLTIPMATEKDSGMYICFGANPMGYNFRSAFLTVLPNPRRIDREPRDDTPPLALIIGLPAAILVVVVIAAIYVLSKRRRSQETPVTKTVVRQRPQGAAPPANSPPAMNVASPYANGQGQEKYYDHQYAALRPQPPGQVTTYAEAPYQSGSSENSGHKSYSHPPQQYSPHMIEGTQIAHPSQVTHGPQQLQQQQLQQLQQQQQLLTHGSQKQPNQHLHYHYGC